MSEQAGSYAFHKSYHDATRNLDDTCRLALFDAMNKLAFEGVDTEFEDQLLGMAWSLIKPNILSSVSHSKRARKADSKTCSKSSNKSSKKTSSKSTPHRTERSGVDKNEFLSSGKKEIHSDASESIAGAAEAAPLSLPEGWEKTGVICTPGRCSQYQLRDSDGGLWCPSCNEADLRLMGVIT